MVSTSAVATGALVVAVSGLAAGFVSGSIDAPTRYPVSIERAEQVAAAAPKLCVPLVGADWERCTARALANQWRSMADTDATHQNTPEAYRVQRFVVAITAFLVQTEHCGALPDPGRATCDHAALTAYRHAVSRVSVPEVTEQGCAFERCPAPARPASRGARLQEM